jgi:hypothetical protein
MPVDTMNQYSYIITPLTMAVAIFLFYRGFKQGFLKDFNINYERIKTVILFLCFITVLFVYYTCNTGGFVQYYFGSTLVITLLLAFFCFLYLIIVLTLPSKDSTTNNGFNKGNFFSNFSKFSVYGTIGFVIYLVISIIGVMYLNGDLNNTPTPPQTLLPQGKKVNPAGNSDAGQSEILSTSKLDSTIFNSNSNSNANDNQGLFLDLSFLKVGGEEYKIDIPLLTSYVKDYNSGINMADNILFNDSTLNNDTTQYK